MGFVSFGMIFALASAIFYHVAVPVSTMREKPMMQSEVVSQALFSEQVERLEESDNWVKIQTKVDGYEGWVLKKDLCEREKEYLSHTIHGMVKVVRHAAHVYEIEDTTYGPILTLPFESRLEAEESARSTHSRWVKVMLPDGKRAYIQRGDISFETTSLISPQEMCSLAVSFLGLPYTWGGRSSFGYDCSGFVQMLFRQMGIYLPRDSKDQCVWRGFAEVDIQDMEPGDLLFWGYSETKIRHVGVYLGEGKFVHAVASVENQPYIRISNLTDFEWKASNEGQLYPYRTVRKLKTQNLIK